MAFAQLEHGESYVLLDGTKFLRGEPRPVSAEVAEYLAGIRTLDQRQNVIAQFCILEALPESPPADRSAQDVPVREITSRVRSDATSRPMAAPTGVMDLGGVGVRHE